MEGWPGMGWGGGAHYCPLALPSRKGEREETADITHTTVQQKHKTKLYTHRRGGRWQQYAQT